MSAAVEVRESVMPGPDPHDGARADVARRLRVVVGERMRLARRLSGMEQKDAAAAIGYEKSTQLSLIEEGHRNAPLLLLVAASRVYSVSVDFLLGLCDEPDRDARLTVRSAMLRHVGRELERQATTISGSIAGYMEEVHTPIRRTRGLVLSVAAALDAFDRFATVNKDAFDELPQGSRVVYLMGAIKPLLADVVDGIESMDKRVRIMEAAQPLVRNDITRIPKASPRRAQQKDE